MSKCNKNSFCVKALMLNQEKIK